MTQPFVPQVGDLVQTTSLKGRNFLYLILEVTPTSVTAQNMEDGTMRTIPTKSWQSWLQSWLANCILISRPEGERQA